MQGDDDDVVTEPPCKKIKLGKVEKKVENLDQKVDAILSKLTLVDDLRRVLCVIYLSGCQ